MKGGFWLGTMWRLAMEQKGEHFWLARRFLYGFAAAIFLTFATGASADPPDNRPPDNRPPDNRPPDRGSQSQSIITNTIDVVSNSDASANNTNEISANSDSGGNTLTGGSQEVQVNVNLSSASENGDGVNGRSGSASSQNVEGDTLTLDAGSSDVNIDTTNESNFFAFSTTFPQASGCFSGTQGGGGTDSGTGFLGFHWMNNDCWMSQLAEAEKSGEVQALLKCGSKKFRNAISFRIQKKDRQEHCVDYMVTQHNAEITFMEQAVSSAVASGDLGVIATSPK
jgi:hypothetical protein